MNRKIIAMFFVLLAPFSFAYADLKTDIEAGVDSSETLNNEVAALMEADSNLTPAAAKLQAETNMISALVSLGMTESAAGVVVSRVAAALTATAAPSQVVTIPDAVKVKQLVDKAVAVVTAPGGLIGSGSEDAITIIESLTVPGLSDFLVSVIANDPVLLAEVTVNASLFGPGVAQLFAESISIY
jgi:hypothetical protein